MDELKLERLMLNPTASEERFAAEPVVPQFMPVPQWDDLRTFVRDTDRFSAVVDRLREHRPPIRYRLGRLFVRTMLRDVSYRKFLDFKWQHVIDLMADQVVRNRDLLRLSPEERSPVAISDVTQIGRRFNQLPCTKVTAKKRVSKALELVDRDSPILLLGDDDAVSIELERAGFSDITVLDIDKNVIAQIELARQSDSIRCAIQDFNDPFPTDLMKNYRLVIMDPIYTIDGIKMFLNSGLKACQQKDECIFFLNAHLMSLMPGGLEALQALLDNYGLRVIEFHQGFNSYPVPSGIKKLIYLVNRHLIVSKALTIKGYSFPYFLSDALILKRSFSEEGR